MFQRGKLSDKQSRLLKFIYDFQRERGYAPSIRDMVQGCGLSSTSVAEYNLRILEREGYLRRDHEVSRGISFLESQGGVPLVGVIAAGSPIPVPQAEGWRTAPWEYVEVPAEFIRGRGEVFALRVKGESMLDALVADGDIIVLQAASSAQDGEMVAVWLKKEGEVTLKKFYREGARVRLQPANSSMPPIYVKTRNVEIQGKVIGLLRRL